MGQASDISRLVVDLGGTHVRFAMLAPGQAAPEQVRVRRVAEHGSLEEAARAYLADIDGPAPREGAIAVATAVLGDEVAITNAPWRFSVSALRAALGLTRLTVLNDFTALALALPQLPREALLPIGGGAAVAGKPVALIGPGTGLGVSGLLPDGRGGWVALEGEGGHQTLSATTAREEIVRAAIAAAHGHASAERFLSGPGLVTGYRALCAADGVAPHARVVDGASLDALAEAGGDPRAVEIRQQFCAQLGTVAGNLVLMLGAVGGLYLGGGILPRWKHWLAGSAFRERFEAKGRYRGYLSRVPVWLIDSPVSPALWGAGAALDAGRYGYSVNM